MEPQLAISCVIDHSNRMGAILEISEDIDEVCHRSSKRIEMLRHIAEMTGLGDKDLLQAKEHVLILQNYNVNEFLDMLGDLKNSSVLYQLVTGKIMIEDIYKG